MITYSHKTFRTRIITFLYFTFLFSINPVGLLADDFDPDTVKPKSCNDKQFNCGLMFLSEEEFQSIPVASHIASRGLPSSFDLSNLMPPIGDQGNQGSCVAWTTGYGIKSYQEKLKRNWGDFDPPWLDGKGERIFSPAFVYNQINGGRDNGSSIIPAMQLLVNQGAATWYDMPYNVKDFRRQPSTQIKERASGFRSDSFQRINPAQINTIKGVLVRGTPIAFGIPVTESFYQLKDGVYDKPTGANYGGHAMILVGYDDNKSYPGGKGAFKMMNSWSARWGDKGYGWISYKLWAKIGRDTVALRTNPGVQEPVVQQNDEPTTINPPATVEASRGSFTDKIEVRWSSVESSIGYLVYRRQKNESNFRRIGSSQNTTYSDKNALEMVAYEYKIQAFKDERISSKWEDSPVAEGYRAAKPIKKVPPQVVGIQGGLEKHNNRTRVLLKWTKLSEATRYEVYRMTGRGFGSWRLLGRTTKSEFTDKAPISDKENIYAIRGVNKSGKGEWSESFSILVPQKNIPPLAVNNLRASKGTEKNRIIVNWNKSVGAKEYTIYRFDYSQKKWDVIGKTKNTRYVDQNLPDPSAWFAYNIIASNSAGDSPFSTSALGRANPALSRSVANISPPSNVNFSMVDKEKGEITWDPVPKATGYYLFLAKQDGTGEFKESISAKSRKISVILPPSDELHFYYLKTKSDLGESVDSERVMVASEPPDVKSRNQVTPGDGWDRFLGTWEGEYMENNKPPVSVKLNIEGKYDNYSVTMNWGREKSRTFNGSYGLLSDYIESGGFYFHLLNDFDGLAELNLREGVRGRKIFRLTLEKLEISEK